MMEEIFNYAAGISSVVTLLALLIKPIREKLFGLRKIEEGEKSMIRNEILKIYYKHQTEETLRQYERDSLDQLYAAYDAMHGNSFVHDIYAQMRTWKVTQ